MTRDELEYKVQEMYYDKNMYINSGLGTEIQIECCKYGREVLEHVLRMIRALDK